MIRKLTSACLIAVAALLTVTALAKTPQTRSKESECKHYAQSAVSDYRSMVDHPKCRVADSPRWQPNYENHYNWCMGVPKASRVGESKARDAHLRHCKARVNFD